MQGQFLGELYYFLRQKLCSLFFRQTSGILGRNISWDCMIDKKVGLNLLVIASLAAINTTVQWIMQFHISWSSANLSFQFIASYVQYSMENLAGDLLLGSKFV